MNNSAQDNNYVYQVYGIKNSENLWTLIRKTKWKTIQSLRRRERKQYKFRHFILYNNLYHNGNFYLHIKEYKIKYRH
jgi:hypothetical protein